MMRFLVREWLRKCDLVDCRSDAKPTDERKTM